MAEAFARILGSDGVEAYSAGSKPSGVINPRAVSAMQEFGYDLTVHDSKSLDALPPITFDVAITMGCGDECPHILARERVDWALPDPRDMSPGEYLDVCNAIREKVNTLLIGLGVSVV